MTKIDSEKSIERKLKGQVEKKGGICIKLQCDFFSGLPDRLVLFPGGSIVFVELKTTKQKPRPIQLLVHERLRKIGYSVCVIDSLDGVDKLIEEYAGHQQSASVPESDR